MNYAGFVLIEQEDFGIAAKFMHYCPLHFNILWNKIE